MNNIKRYQAPIIDIIKVVLMTTLLELAVQQFLTMEKQIVVIKVWGLLLSWYGVWRLIKEIFHKLETQKKGFYDHFERAKQYVSSTKNLINAIPKKILNGMMGKEDAEGSFPPSIVKTSHGPFSVTAEEIYPKTVEATVVYFNRKVEAITREQKKETEERKSSILEVNKKLEILENELSSFQDVDTQSLRKEISGAVFLVIGSFITTFPELIVR